MRREVGRVWAACGEDTTSVLRGRKVAGAFGLGHLAPFTRQDVVQIDGGNLLRYVILPHPSGRCRVWNEPDAVERARALLRQVRPDVPWGELCESESGGAS